MWILITNATMLDKGIMEELIEAGLTHIGIFQLMG